ncbi:MAG: hypothetical protein QW751_03270 [Candidatus Aenigmatarchaeota archaeon]|nr:hypothetical protein [Candidatus Aenigmarchaeota archaeon]
MQPEREWAKLRKKYRKLPDWKWLDANFRIKIEEGRLVDNVRIGIMDKLDHIAHDMIEPIIGGGENYCCYFERRMLTEAERERMFDIYRQLMAILWVGNHIAVEFSEKDFAEWVTTVYNDWEKLKPVITELFDKIAVGWTEYKKPSTETAYHG